MNDLPAPEPDAAPPPDLRLEQLIALATQLLERQEEDPFGNPVLAISLLLSRRLDEGSLGIEDVGALVCRLRDDAFERRAARLARYVGLGPEPVASRLGPHRRPAGPARPRRQPGAAGAVPRRHPAHPLRRGVHRASHLRAGHRGLCGAGRHRQRQPGRSPTSPRTARPCLASTTSSSSPRRRSNAAATPSTG